MQLPGCKSLEYMCRVLYSLFHLHANKELTEFTYEKTAGYLPGQMRLSRLHKVKLGESPGSPKEEISLIQGFPNKPLKEETPWCCIPLLAKVDATEKLKLKCKVYL